MNTANVRDLNYQTVHTNDQVFNPNRIGLDLNNQRGQGEFDSRPAVPQFGIIDLDLILIPLSILHLYHKYSLGNLNKNSRG